MGPLELAGIVATIAAGLVAVYAFFFGTKPLAVLLREWWAKRRREKRPRLLEIGENKARMTPESGRRVSTDLGGDPGTRVRIARFEQGVGNVKELVSSSQYTKAVVTAKRHRDAMIAIGDEGDLEFQLTLGELDVWYAHALIYTGETENAIRLLERVIANLEDRGKQCQPLPFGSKRWNRVLGRAHNHIGYASWMDWGYYEVALKKFRAAIRHFLAGDLKEELATAFDNMGRVYAQLGYRTRAELLIEQGRRIRDWLRDEYRYALSLNSGAIAHLAFGQPFRAYIESEEALTVFRQQEENRGKRGTGLALLTKGRALRYLSAYRKYSRETQRFEGYLVEATERLKEAEEIFLEVVEEDIRLCWVYNELGCTYRERAALAQGSDTESAVEAEYYLKKCVETAADKYPVLYVDACEDLARTYFVLGERRKAERWMRKAEEAIPSEYKVGKDVESRTIAPQQCVEDFWQQLGKIHILCGEMTFDKRNLPTGIPDKDFPQNLQRAIEHYALASCYFARFLERPLSPVRTVEDEQLYPPSRPQLANHRLFIEHVYDRLSLFEAKELQYVDGRILPDLRETYRLKPSWLDRFREDALGPLLQIGTTGPLAE